MASRRVRAAVSAAVLAAVATPAVVSASVSHTAPSAAVVRPSETAATAPSCIIWDDDAGAYVFTVGACTL